MVFRDRISLPPTDQNIIAILNSGENAELANSLFQQFEAENAAMGRTQKVERDVLRATLRHYWKVEDYFPSTLEKSMKVRYYNGILNFLRREIQHICERG